MKNTWKKVAKFKKAWVIISVVILTGVLIYINSDFIFGKFNHNNENDTMNFKNNVVKRNLNLSKNKINFRDIRVKALYLAAYTVGNESWLSHYIKLANETEINSYVVDIKSDDGLLSYKSKVKEVNEFKGYREFYNPESLIKKMHKNNIYTIGRLVCFKDPVMASKKNSLAIKDKNNNIWRDSSGIAWLDPYNKANWKIIAKVAKEALEYGFDEIQFDYIRFPNDGNIRNMNFNNKGISKSQIINEFIGYMRKEMPDKKLSADVFGIICLSPGDSEGIGQNLDEVGKDNLDYISPMVYPSHYANGQIINGKIFPNPDLDSYGVVKNTLQVTKSRIDKIPKYKAKVRPYLQDFTASWLGSGSYKVYSVEDVRNQIKAVYDSGFKEWIFWNASGNYSEGAFKAVDN